MKHIAVDSSWLASAAFEGGVIEVTTKAGKTYTYQSADPDNPITQKFFDEFMSAKSQGSFFGKNIAGKFPRTAVEPIQTTPISE